MARRRTPFRKFDWPRVLQIVRVEEPVTVHGVKKIARDLTVLQTDRVLIEMSRAGILRLNRREAPDGQTLGFDFEVR